MRPALLWTEPAPEQLRVVTTVDRATAAAPLDGYVNMLYRSLKNERAGLALASLLDAHESVASSLASPASLRSAFRSRDRGIASIATHTDDVSARPRMSDARRAVPR